MLNGIFCNTYMCIVHKLIKNMCYFLLQNGSSSEEDSNDSDSIDEDYGSFYIDGEFDEELLDNDSAIPHPSSQIEPNEHPKILLTWLVYFILMWQYKNYISDHAIEQLWTFVKAFFTCAATALQPHVTVELLMVLATNLPTTLYSARKLLNVNRDSFIRYAVCPKCTKLYKMDSILQNDGQ